jgi:uncharacterized protein (TIRG00374 family)
MRNAITLSRGRFLVVVASIAIAAAGYLTAALWSGWEQVTAAVGQVGWMGTGIVLAISLLSYVVRSVRWGVFLRALSYPMPPTDNVRIYLAGFALTTTPGRLGETLRSILLRPFGVPYATSIGAFVADRFCDLAGILLITGILAQFFYPAARFIALVFAAVLGVMLVIYRQEHRALELMHKLAERVSRKAAFAVSALALAESALICVQPRRFAMGIAVTCIAWGMQAVALAYLLTLMDSGLPLLMAIFIFFFATLAGAASMIPGGLGSQEATMIGLLTLNGVGSAQAIAATVILRVATLWFGVAVGLCSALIPPVPTIPTAPQTPRGPQSPIT